MTKEVNCPKCQSKEVSQVGGTRYEKDYIQRNYKCQCGHTFTHKEWRDVVPPRGGN